MKPATLRIAQASLLLLLLGAACRLPAQDLEWAYGNYGFTGGIARPGHLTMDAEANLIVVGTPDGDVDLDPGPGTVYPLADGDYVQKVDSAGDLIWVKEVPMLIRKVYADSLGNVHLVGKISDTVDVDPGAGVFLLYPNSTSQTAAAYVKLSPAGTFLNAFCVGASHSTDGNLLSWEDDGNLYMSGSFRGTGDFDPGAGTYTISSATTHNTFVLKIDATGAFQWAIGTEVSSFSGYCNPGAMVLTHGGDLMISGHFAGTVDFLHGPGVLARTSSVDGPGWLMRLDAAGAMQWCNAFGAGSVEVEVPGMVPVGTGEVVVGGHFYGSTDFDPGPGIAFIPSGTRSPFLARFDATGALVWVRGQPDNPGMVKGLVTDGYGNLLACGLFQDTLDLDWSAGIAWTVTGIGMNDGWVSSYTPSGDFIRGFALVGDGNDDCVGIAGHKSGRWVVTGRYEANLDCDPGPGFYTVPDPVFGWATYVANYRLNDTCGIGFSLDTLVGFTCTASAAYAVGYAAGGLPPYSFTWATSPPTTGPSVTFASGGLYEVTISDAAGCSTDRMLLVDGPSEPAALDLACALTGPPTMTITGGGALTVHGWNEGCASENGILRLVLDSRVNSVVFHGTPPTSVSVTGDTLDWAFSGMTYDDPGIHCLMSVMATSGVVLGDTLCHHLSILPLAFDVNHTNNESNLCQVVNAPHDPNYKQVHPSGNCPENYALLSEPLTYTVHFQNIGTAPATDVLIQDTLDAALDLTSLTLLHHTHYVWTEVAEDSILKFHFPGINLADSASDPIGSQGEVTFSLKTLSGTAIGTQVRNAASIYFDTNDPIHTNAVMNTMVNVMPSCGVNASNPEIASTLLHVWPNPAQGVLHVSTSEGVLQVQVFDVQGRLLLTRMGDGGKAMSLDASAWPRGMVLVQVRTAQGVQVQRVVMQ